MKEKLGMNAPEKAFEESLKSEPKFLREFREKSFESFLRAGFPNAQNEEWKYINLENLLRTDLQYYSKTKPENLADYQKIIAENALPECQERLIVLVNGKISAELSSLKEINKKIIICSLKEAEDKYKEIFQRHFNQIKNQDTFTHLNGSFSTEGLFLCIPDEISSNEPIQVLCLSSNEEKSLSIVNYPRNLVLIGQRAKANLVINSLGSENESYLSNLVNEIFLEKSAKLELAFVQNESKEAFQMAFSQIKLNEGAEIIFHNFSLGGKLSRHKIEADLMGENSICCLNGLYVQSGNSASHNQIVLNHEVPFCASSQIYKGILDDEAKAEFSGTINVNKQAIKTDAKQLNRNLLLSDKAKIETRPQLQILADDVKCSHGATIGQLSEEQIFYLSSRGISRKDAKRALTYGFAEEIIEKVKINSLKSRLDELFLKNIHQIEQK